MAKQIISILILSKFLKCSLILYSRTRPIKISHFSWNWYVLLIT